MSRTHPRATSTRGSLPRSSARWNGLPKSKPDAPPHAKPRSRRMDSAAERRSKLESIAFLQPSSREQLLKALDDEAWDHVLAAWTYNARPHQLEPPGDWRIWLFLGGRGAGKTRAGAEWVAEEIRGQRVERAAPLAAS